MADALDLTGRKIWVAGHRGLVGSAVVRRLKRENCQILTVPRQELDLCDARATENWMDENRPKIVIVAAAKVGGIGANAAYPADFLHDNLSIANNIIHAAYKFQVRKLVFLGSSCIYPKFATQPIAEDALLSSPLEPTNEAYAIAKIAGLKLCQFYRRQYGCDFISLMPCNIYGANDRWADENAHVIPALISRMHKAKLETAKSVNLWGSGAPLREFLYADDLADGIVHALKIYSDDLHLNIGSGEEITIRDLAELIKKTVGFTGDLIFDPLMPDGTPRKILDCTRLHRLGWHSQTSLEKGLKAAYEDFLNHVK